MDNLCVCCGEIIPEGRQVCLNCEFSINERTATEPKVSKKIQLLRVHIGEDNYDI